MTNLYEFMKKTLGAKPCQARAQETLPPTSKSVIAPALSSLLDEFKSPIEFEFGANFISSDNEEYWLAIIYGTNNDNLNIHYVNSSLPQQIPKGYFAFGDTGEGDYFCISDFTGAVFFWQHDSLDDGLKFLSRDICTFILALTPDTEPSDNDLRELDKIVKFEIDF